MRRAAFRRAWFYCFKKKNTIGIGRRAPPAEELRVVEAACGVRLPDLEDQVVERRAVELGDAAGDLDHLANRFFSVKDSQIIGALRELAREERPGRHFSAGDQSLHGMPGAALRPRTTS